MYTRAIILTLSLFALVSGKSHQRWLETSKQQGTQVVSSEDRAVWWDSLTSEAKEKLESIYDPNWFASVDTDTQIAYTHLANSLYDFINGDADAHDDDSYKSFAPILLRSAFHSSGTYFLPDGSGGSNGGTIFNHGELEDGGNGCIDKATTQLETLFHEHDTVPLSDAIIIAGVVALDVMNFPRMDLVRVAGGRDMIDGVAFRGRLPSPDDDPLENLTRNYGFSLPELVALIGGAHNFGSAHGKCSGYVGQWTSTPLSWFGINGTDPTFFSDLLRDDWRWYEVCTFHNDTVVYKSIEDPFESDAEEEHEEEQGGSLSLGCPMMRSQEPLTCEKQAMRGCEFRDGKYPLGEAPCDANALQMRLVSDFFLKKNPYLLPHSEAFAMDADRLAEEFGGAFRKLTHLGLDRCGMNGHGCDEGTTCAPSLAEREYKAPSGSEVCILDEEFIEQQQDAAVFGFSDDTVRAILFASALIVMACITAVCFMWSKMRRVLSEKAASSNPATKPPPAIAGKTSASTNPSYMSSNDKVFLEM